MEDIRSFFKKKVIIKVAEVDETFIGKGRNLASFRVSVEQFEKS